MVEDNTPARKRKATRHMRLRLETVKKLRALGAQKKAAKEKEKAEKVTVTDPTASNDRPAPPAPIEETKTTSTINPRKPKVKRKATLAKPPLPKSKFRKRQTHKSWLPTHLFHAKRAHMTPPSAPLWRFAIPLTPTQKSYRPTHRASHERGAVAWDVSYMATIGLEGEERSLVGVLKGLGVEREGAFGQKGEKWRGGTRALESFVFEREPPQSLVAPVTIIWCVTASANGAEPIEEVKTKRKLFLRVHPSVFYQLWEEVVRLAKVAKPGVSVEDLRFEIGSIEITGPGSTEALLGALWPCPANEDVSEPGVASVERTWTNLAGVTNPAMLPTGSLLAFNTQDPRLHHPPRTIKLPNTQDEQNSLLELLSTWPVDKIQIPSNLFSRPARSQGSKLSSQKSINRRKSLAKPGDYPQSLPTDPRIPILMYTSPLTSTTNKKQQQPSWTLLAPWKTIQPIWYAIMYYPLSTGQQPRFSGLREQQQLAFEAGRPWFPADFLGTKAGWEWEVQERRRRWEEWKRRPKSKRISWEKVDLGNGKKGELGEGWACDWAVLLGEGKAGAGDAGVVAADTTQKNDSTQRKTKDDAPSEQPAPPPKPNKLSQLTSTQALALLNPSSTLTPPATDLEGKLITVRLTLLTRGVPQTCARIYHLPSASTDPELRNAWLALLPRPQRKQKGQQSRHSLPQFPKDAPQHLVQQRLAQSLLEPPRAGGDHYPACPPQEDLVGFVTSGNFNLAEGQGTGFGNLLVSKVVEDTEGVSDEARLCVVRNAGADVGRLARWEVV